MTKEELLNLDTNIYFICSMSSEDKLRVKDLERYEVVDEQIISTFDQETTNENGEVIINKIEKIELVTHIARVYVEGENWMTVQNNLFNN